VEVVKKLIRGLDIGTLKFWHVYAIYPGMWGGGGGVRGGTICAADSKGRQYGKQKECFKRKNLPLILNY